MSNLSDLFRTIIRYPAFDNSKWGDPMEQKTYYAKSARMDGSRPTVAQHVDAVAERAAAYGAEAGISGEARLAGLMHDFGKYSEAFQDVLRGARQNIDHAACGAAALWYRWGGKPRGCQRAVIEAVNGHHAGLKDYDSLGALLRASFEGQPYLTVNDGKTPALSGKAEYGRAIRCFQADHPGEPLDCPKEIPGEPGNLETMLYTRMLFSCLVDADYSVSAWEDDRDYFRNTDAPPLDAGDCLERLYAFRENIRSHSTADPGVNRIRDLVFDKCGACGGAAPGGLFTLTAPTGTGKTLALLHFALRHALANGKRRIIIVLPFLTLAEQNAAAYGKIMPDVLTDHSQSRLGEEMREFTAKWNVPFLITTSVKFFETLFAKAPSDCRKLHNLARSVVVFDEAQSLPPQLTGATLQAVNELCARYQMTMVFSTATQPDFDAIPGLGWKPREILPENPALYEQLRRVEVDWRLNGRIPPEDIAGEMLERESVCGIFNLRRHARTVFERLREEDPESAFLISTDLCPAHRTWVVEQIRGRLAAGKPCRVAATQCIEAGVDLDFRVLYRALAPLDSVIQAAGRCNRNGGLDRGRVVVFEPDDRRLYPDNWYQNAANLVKSLVQSGGVDINDPGDIKRYYSRLFAGARDKKELTKALAGRDFEAVDRHYRLIPDGGEKLIVPYAGLRVEYDVLRAELQKNGITPGLMKQAAPLTITVFDKGDLERFAEPVLLRTRGSRECTPSGCWLLRAQYEECYTDHGGLKLPDTVCSQDFTY